MGFVTWVRFMELCLFHTNLAVFWVSGWVARCMTYTAPTQLFGGSVLVLGCLAQLCIYQLERDHFHYCQKRSLSNNCNDLIAVSLIFLTRKRSFYLAAIPTEQLVQLSHG